MTVFASDTIFLFVFLQGIKSFSNNSSRPNNKAYTRCYSSDCQETHHSKLSLDKPNVTPYRSNLHIYPSPFQNHQWRIKDTTNIDHGCDGTSSSASSSHSSCSQCQQPIYHSSAKSEPSSNILRMNS